MYIPADPVPHKYKSTDEVEAPISFDKLEPGMVILLCRDEPGNTPNCWFQLTQWPVLVRTSAILQGVYADGSSADTVGYKSLRILVKRYSLPSWHEDYCAKVG